ncbi:hypothetical protein D3C71_1077200 [compost metagenome]
MDLADKAVGGQPFGDGVGLKEGAVDAVGGGAQNAVESYGAGSHGVFAFEVSGSY